MSKIADFSGAELWVIKSTLRERYGRPVEPEPAEAELRLDPHSTELVVCPSVYWEQRGARFIVTKTGDGRYRCQFFYSVREQYGTGIEEYNDIGECITALLQVQADHERSRPGR